jgi:hypothetical protein
MNDLDQMAFQFFCNNESLEIWVGIQSANIVPGISSLLTYKVLNLIKVGFTMNPNSILSCSNRFR